MKSRILFFLLFSFSVSLYAKTPIQDTIIKHLSQKLTMAQNFIDFQLYHEVVFIRNEYNDTFLKLNVNNYISSLNDIYYKRFFPFTKLLNPTSEVTEDCITEDNGKLLDAYKLLYYSYNSGINLPNDYFQRLQTASMQDEALAPYYCLQIIYFIKKYKLTQLSLSEKNSMEALELNLSNQLYTRFVENKSWDFYKLLATKVLIINNNPLAKKIDLSGLIQFYSNQPQLYQNNYNIDVFEADNTNNFLLGSIGMKRIRMINTINTLWILLHINHD